MVDLKGRPFYLDEEAEGWVRDTLAGMTTEEKVGQLFCLVLRSDTKEELDSNFRKIQPGGFMYRVQPVETLVKLTEELAKRSKYPLLIAANLEKGGSGIAEEGTFFASPLEVAATDDVVMANHLAEICATEGRACGANWAFAPIVDIDGNFRNPITNTRTFGSDAGRVAAMGKEYVTVVQRHGMAASIKHFPGDGQDERDQHLVTSVNPMSCEEWDASYGMIYRECIEAGALSCMVGHIMLPSYAKRINPALKDEEILPGSLSQELMQGLLRERLGFNGLIVTDATTMAGYTLAMSRKDAVPHSIAAGADMFLFTRNVDEDIEFMFEGVKNGVITAERLDEAVTRILALKAALGLHRRELPDLAESKRTVIQNPVHTGWARECADRAITLVKEQKGVLPLTADRYRRILLYKIEKEGGFGQYKVKQGACEEIRSRLEQEGFVVDLFCPEQGNEGETAKYMDIVRTYDLIVYVANLATFSNQTCVRIEWAKPMGADCAHYLNDVPTIFISLENPYHLLDIPRVKTFINTYSSNDYIIDALIEKLTGRSEFTGISPVDAFCGKWDTHL